MLKPRYSVDLIKQMAECDANYIRLLKLVTQLAVYRDMTLSNSVESDKESRYLVKNPKMYSADEKMRVNAFLGEWLTHCLKVGRSIQTPEKLFNV